MQNHSPIGTKCNFHSMPVDEVLEKLGATKDGLSEDASKKRLEKYGPNEILTADKKHPIHLFIKQFQSIFVYVLLLAVIISFAVGHDVDAYIIFAVIIINAIIGFIQEYRAEKTIQLLRKMVKTYAIVLRGGEIQRVTTSELVPGDILLLEEGNKVPADARIIECKDLKVLESHLTGESKPVVKIIEPVQEKALLGDRKNMVWMGTMVASGSAKAVVCSTGQNTAMGEISKVLKDVMPPKGHYEKSISELVRFMSTVALFGAVMTFLIGYFLIGLELFEMFLFALASLVSGIPEGLLIVLAIVLAIGANRMAGRKALVRHLPSIETIGSVTVIASDKTGTLTQNTMNVEKLYLFGSAEISVSGRGWEPEGEFTKQGEKILPKGESAFRKVLEIAAMCNNTRVKKLLLKEREIIGDPTEAALVVMAEKAGFTKKKLKNKIKIIEDYPFSTEQKYRATLVETNSREIFFVGAPEILIEKSSGISAHGGIEEFTDEKKNEVRKKVSELAMGAMRVVALAYRPVAPQARKISGKYEEGLIFAGAVGMHDPPRPEVKGAIEKARRAGIRVIMKTGDHKETALAVAKEIGLIGDEEIRNSYPHVLTESELSGMNDEELSEAVGRVNVFARLTPKMKFRLVEALQAKGEVVAMTGDGVNDAPALKKADVGIAMGITGTDVARDASEMILSDDNFASIINAVEEGRIAFKNIRQTTTHLLTTSISESFTIISCLFLGLPLPLLAKHILWLNLVTDGTGDIALATEPSHQDEMSEPPRPSKEPVIAPRLFPFMGMMVLVMSAGTIGLFYIYLPLAGLETARTVAFLSMMLCQLFNLWNMRSMKKSILEIGPFSNKWVNADFVLSIGLVMTGMYVPIISGLTEFVPLGIDEWGAAIGVSSFVLIIGEIYKYAKRNGF